MRATNDRRVPRRIIPAAMVVEGIVLVFAGLYLSVANEGVAGLLSPLGVVNLVVFVLLGGVVAGCGVVLAWTDIGPDRYRRAALWSVGSATALLLLNVPVMLLVSDIPPSFLRGWVLSILGIGAAAGAAIGVMEARAIERARAAERESIRAETARAEADYLDYLNSLLRHEVLNAVNIINGYATIAEEQADGEVADYLAKTRTQSADIAGVISDIRVLNEAHKPAPAPVTVDLGAALEGQLDRLDDTYDVAIDATVPTVVTVTADELLPRAFWNLLSNAVEHNDARSPRVEVTVETDDDHVHVRIADNGPGFTPKARESLFKRSQHRNHGLGLYLVKRVVDRSDGSVELTETGPDGSVFTVTLPRAPTADDGEREPTTMGNEASTPGPA